MTRQRPGNAARRAHRPDGIAGRKGPGLTAANPILVHRRPPRVGTAPPSLCAAQGGAPRGAATPLINPDAAPSSKIEAEDQRARVAMAAAMAYKNKKKGGKQSGGLSELDALSAFETTAPASGAGEREVEVE